MISIFPVPPQEQKTDTRGRVCRGCGCENFRCLGRAGAVKYYRCTACGRGFGVWCTDDEPDDEPDTPPAGCAMCGGAAFSFLGRLGRVSWWRCRGCGHDIGG